MSKDADKDVVDSSGTQPTRRRRKKSGLRIPSDNVPRSPSSPIGVLTDTADAELDDDDGIVAPVPEDPNVAVSVAFAFAGNDEASAAQYPASREGANEVPPASDAVDADSDDDDLETRRTTQMPAISLEELGLSGAFDMIYENDGEAAAADDDDDVEIDIEEDDSDAPSSGAVEAVQRAATVALSDDDLEELIESSDNTSAAARRMSTQGRRGAQYDASIDMRTTQPIPVLSETALAAYVGDDDDDGLGLPERPSAGSAGTAQQSKPHTRRQPEPGVPAAVAALEKAGVESPHDTPLTIGDAGDSGELLSEDLIEEVDDSDVQVEDDAHTSRPPTPPASQAARKPPPAPREKGAESQPKPKRRKGKPWFEEIFDEDYLRTLPFLTPQATQAEAAFVSSALEADPGAQILDIGCGYGRHAMELAARGYQVVALDLSLPLLLRGADEAQRRGLNINFVHGDMRDLSFEGQFDGAYCLFSTFGYFDDVTNKKTAEGIARALKPGGHLVIEILNRDYLIADLPARVWWEGDGCVVLEEVDFNYFSSRIVSRRSVVFDDGRQLEQEISLRAYSLHEFGKLLHGAGFRVVEVSGSMATRGRFFGNQSREIIVVAAKREAGSSVGREGMHQFPRGVTSADNDFQG